MNIKNTRQVVFVCIGLNSDNKILSKIVNADTPDQASSLFLEQENIKAQEVLGPFYKKRTRVIENTRQLKFSNESKKAIYDDWLVTAMLLKEPENQAYLIFIKRTDDKKVPPPKGTVVVPISDLRFEC